MDYLVIISEIIAVISILLLWIVITYNSYQSFIIRINEVETKIDTILRKKFDLVSKCIEVIETYTGKEEFEDIDKFKWMLDRYFINPFKKVFGLDSNLSYEDVENETYDKK